LVRYVNGALVGAWDALRRRGVSDGDAAAMLSGAFEVGIAVIETVRSHQSCWEASVPGNALGNWYAAGGPLIDWQITSVLGTYQIDWSLFPNNQLALICPGYWSQLESGLESFKRALQAVTDETGWSEVMDASIAEASTRARPNFQGVPRVGWLLLVLLLLAAPVGARVGLGRILRG
jgi:hypothetical protein